MHFSSAVHKYQKWILGSIVAVMAITLVISFTPAGGVSGDQDEVVATYFGDFKVTRREFQEARALSFGYLRWKWMNEQLSSKEPMAFYIQQQLFQRQGRPGILTAYTPTEDDIKQAPRELIILGTDARHKGVRVSDEEVDGYLRDLFAKGGAKPGDPDSELSFTVTFFRLNPPEFRRLVERTLAIRKAIEIDTYGANARWGDVVQGLVASSKAGRASVIGVDPDALPGQARSFGPEEISAKFEQDKEKYRLPEKVQVEYLMASVESFKKKAAEPTAEQIQKYYDDNKRQFVKVTDHFEGDGHDHGQEPPKEEFKELAEVKSEIIDKIKTLDAQKAVAALVEKINSRDVAEALDAIEKKVRAEVEAEMKDASAADKAKAVRERRLAATEPVLDGIRRKYVPEGIELVHNVSSAFERSKLESIEAELGKASSPAVLEAIFAAQAGDIPNKIWRSDKGQALVRLARKVDSYVPDLSDPIRDKIRKELAAEEKRKRAERVATEIVEKITRGGEAALAEIRRRTADVYQWQQTGYFDAEARGDFGLSPSSLGATVKNLVVGEEKPVLARLEAYHVAGSQVGGDKVSWSYVVVAEDVVSVRPDLKDEDVKKKLSEKEEELRSTRYRDRANELVGTADWRDLAEVR